MWQEELLCERRWRSQAKWWKQLSTLTQRSTRNMSRDLGYYWLRIAIYIVLSICVGTIFFDIGTSYTAILARGSCGGFISGFMTFMSIGGFPCFIEEMKVKISSLETPLLTECWSFRSNLFSLLKQVFYRERLNGHYGIAVYILSNFLSSFPFLTVMSIASSSITYYMVKFRSGISHYIYACLDLICSIAVVESCMMMIASVVPNFMMGIIVGAGYLVRTKLDQSYMRFFLLISANGISFM